MALTQTQLSIQEAAVAFAKNMATLLNAAAAETVGVEVMWFRAKPDHRSEDVIFQSYTLWGVDDCPLTFKVVYSDTGYDDAAITYNIMGLEYAIPMTLEIALKTWTDATENDGTLPQRGDIVFIPISNKLVEVVSMTPVKSIGAQITSYKVNCAVYKPTRSRLVGDNLKESIAENTTSLFDRFGEKIDNTIKNVVDAKQLDMFNSTPKDKFKEVVKVALDSSLVSDRRINNIISDDLIFDGHIVARTLYDMEVGTEYVVKYLKGDTLNSSCERCYSAWFNLKEHDTYKNIKKISTNLTSHGVPTGSYINIDEYSGKRISAGTNVVIERGNLVLCGVVDDSEQYRIKVHPNLIKGLNKNIKNWTSLTGYIIREDNIINLLTGYGDLNLKVNIKANNYISISIDGSEILIQFNTKLKADKWYGLILNIGKIMSVDLFEGDPAINHLCGVSNIPNNFWKAGNINYKIEPSKSYITNIRLYDVSNNELDKQITDLVSYNTPYDSHAIINDTADIPVNKEYVGVQR